MLATDGPSSEHTKPTLAATQNSERLAMLALYQASESGSAGAAVAGASIPRRQASEFTYDEFVREYMAPNRPVIIQVRLSARDAEPGATACLWARSLEVSKQGT